jgi:protein-L-isoaspartate(D-aspartate) O-methyltransferase
MTNTAPNFKAARTNMVDGQIHTAGVVRPDILQAFETVPREMFVPQERRGVAYHDEYLPVINGRFLLEPITHAKMVEAVDPCEDDLVLDIGGASGYSAAILAPLVSSVVAVESDPDCFQQAQLLWQDLDVLNVVSYEGALPEGNLENSPFNLIFMNGAVSEIPQSLVNQLEIGGKLITVVKKPGEVLGEVTLVKALGGGEYSSVSLFSAGVPYLPGFEPEREFQF